MRGGALEGHWRTNFEGGGGGGGGGGDGEEGGGGGVGVGTGGGDWVVVAGVVMGGLTLVGEGKVVVEAEVVEVGMVEQTRVLSDDVVLKGDSSRRDTMGCDFFSDLVQMGVSSGFKFMVAAGVEI